MDCRRFKIIDWQHEHWDGYVRQHPQGSIFHTRAMLQAFVAARDFEPIAHAATNEHGKIIALLASAHVKTLRNFPSFASRVIQFAEPLCDATPSGVAALKQIIRHHDKQIRGKSLLSEVRSICKPGVEKDVLTECNYGEEIPLTIEEMAERFVEDIREFRPHGPYCLLGYCSGGTIAFEVAQQLVAAGEKVAFVAGIETYDWGTAQSSRPTPWIKTYYHIQRMEFILRNFLLLKPRDQWEFFKAKLRRVKTRMRNWRGMLAGLFAKQKAVSSGGAVNMHELWRLHDAQADRYRPRPCPGKLLLIRPRKDYASYVGKEDLKAIEGVRVVRIPAFPAGLLSPPYVSQVAKLVSDSMRDGLSEQYKLAPADERRRERDETYLPGALATAATK